MGSQSRNCSVFIYSYFPVGKVRHGLRYECETCGLSYSRKGSLRRHMDYECEKKLPFRVLNAIFGPSRNSVSTNTSNTFTAQLLLILRSDADLSRIKTGEAVKIEESKYV